MGLPRHHPQDEHLLGYASGELRELKSLLVATHLAYCPACRQRVAVFEAQCGAWFDETPIDSIDGHLDALLECLHDRLDTGPPTCAPPAVASPPVTVTAGGDAVPEPLRSWLGGPVPGRAWTEVAPGVWASEWAREAGCSSIRLLRMEPGVRAPAHRHTATEILLVLQGAFQDEYGRFRRGDVVEYEPGSDHRAICDEAEECVCLFLLDGEILPLDEPAA